MIATMRPPCVHCGERPRRPSARGLCWRCSRLPGIRDLYPNGNSTPCPDCGYNLPSNPDMHHVCRKDGEPAPSPPQAILKFRADLKPCPACGLPMHRWSSHEKCSRCRGCNHKPTADGSRFVEKRARGSEVPLPRPDLPGGGLLIAREEFDRLGLHDADIAPRHRGYGESKRYRRKA